MALSLGKKMAMVAATYDAAKAMVDDLVDIREVIAKPIPTNGDLRRTSKFLRRLLIDNGGDLRKISPPRLDHCLRIRAPDFGQDALEHASWYFASFGSIGTFGMTLTMGYAEAKIVQPSVSLPYVDAPRGEFSLYESRPRGLVFRDYPRRNFLAQRIMCYSKHWIKREDVIKYVANIADGVHSGDPNDETTNNLHEVRQLFSAFIDDKGIKSLKVHQPLTISNFGKPIAIEENGIDFVLAQILCAAHYVATSPDILLLENIISRERRGVS